MSESSTTESGTAMSPGEVDIDTLLSQAKANLSKKPTEEEKPESTDRLSKIREGLKSLPTVKDALGDASLKTLPSKGAVKLHEHDKTEQPESGFRKIVDPVKVKQEAKKARESNAGNKWFNMPKPELTQETKRDLQLLQMRSVLDRKRHYKKEKVGVPQYFQTGTIIEGNTEYYSARLSNKERKKTLAEEILADSESRKYFKRKYGEIQTSKLSGRKAHYKKVKELRKKI
jgi:hypothetical protein